MKNKISENCKNDTESRYDNIRYIRCKCSIM